MGPGQSISYNIPSTACPPVKREQIGLVRATGVPIGDLFQIGQNESDIAYSYNCYYKDSCSDERTLHLCVTQGNINDVVVDIYDAQGNRLVTGGDTNGCGSYYFDSKAVKVVITNADTSKPLLVKFL